MMVYEEYYSNEIEKLLRNSVKKVFKLKPVLAKKVKQKGSTEMYCTRVCRPIKEATLCIADLTYNNTNVGFEIGVAQELHKPVIITRYIPKISKKVQLKPSEDKSLQKLKKRGILQYSKVPYKIPSDVGGIFRVDYKDEKDLMKQLKEGFEVK